MPILNRKAMDEVNAGSGSSGQDRRNLFGTSVQRKQEPPKKEYTGSHGLEASEMSRVRKSHERKSTMLSTRLKMGSAWLCLAAIPAIFGCANDKTYTRARVGFLELHGKDCDRLAWSGTASESSRSGTCTASSKRGTTTASAKYKQGYVKRKHNTAFAPRSTSEPASTRDLPPNAKLGECYARVYVPPKFHTMTERILVREASDKIEIIPAVYEWEEARVLVKEASTQLVAVPARFFPQDYVVETSPGHVTWMKADQARCVADTPGPPPQDIFCLVNEPPTTTTILTKRLLKGATFEELIVPAEYQTIRRQKLVRPASMRRVTVPAEFQEVEKTVMVTPASMEWQRVTCDSRAVTKDKVVRRTADRNW